MRSDHGRPEHPGTASDLPALEGWQEDALAERPDCDWCGMSGAERTRIVVHGPDLHFCDERCEREYYTNDEYR